MGMSPPTLPKFPSEVRLNVFSHIRKYKYLVPNHISSMRTFLLYFALLCTLSTCMALHVSTTSVFTADPTDQFCRFKNHTITTRCMTGSECAIRNISTAIEFCDTVYKYDQAKKLPFMDPGQEYVTPYVANMTSCPSKGELQLHVPLKAFRTGNRYASTVCTLSCGKKCDLIADSEGYVHGSMVRTMVPYCHCIGMVMGAQPVASVTTSPPSDTNEEVAGGEALLALQHK